MSPYVSKDWSDGPQGGTPITADDLDRLETQYAQAVADVATDFVAPITPQPRTIAATLPAGEFAWLATDYGMAPRVTFGRDGLARGTVGVSPEALFDRFSTARRAPGATFYVDVATGVDTNNGTAWATPVKSINKALDLALAASPAAGVCINVKAGTYNYTDSMYKASPPLLAMTVDVAFVAVGGRVIDSYSPPVGVPTIHATYTNLYSYPITGNVRGVIDKTYVDELGNNRRYKRALDSATANATPGSFISGNSTTSVLVNPFPGSPPMTQASIQCFMLCNRGVRDINFYMGGATAADGWDLLGADSNIKFIPLAAMAARKTAVLSNVACKYACSLTNDANSITADAYWRGLLACFNVTTTGADRDGFNVHTGTPNPSRIVTVNCRSFDTGPISEIGAVLTSRNGWTIHEMTQGVDVAGEYRLSRGGTVHNISTSKAYMLGALSADDLGDADAGGTIPPTQFKVADTAQLWLQRCLASGSPGALAYAAAAGAAIHLTDPAPTPLASSGPVS